jgi:hypothetical protein
MGVQPSQIVHAVFDTKSMLRTLDLGRPRTLGRELQNHLVQFSQYTWRCSIYYLHFTDKEMELSEDNDFP